eukprot:1543782-Lingulodinium_polyedra.AAC.1
MEAIVVAPVFLRGSQSGRSAGRAPRLNGDCDTLMVCLNVHRGLRDMVRTPSLSKGTVNWIS